MFIVIRRAWCSGGVVAATAATHVDGGDEALSHARLSIADAGVTQKCAMTRCHEEVSRTEGARRGGAGVHASVKSWSCANTIGD